MIGSFSFLLAGRLLGAAAMFLANILIARMLGAEAFGRFALFTAATSLLTLVLPLGMNTVTSFFAAEYAATNHTEKLKGFLAVSIKYILTMALVCTLIALLMMLFTPHLLPPSEIAIYALTLITGTIMALLGLNGGLMVGLKKQVAGSLPESFVRPFLVLSCAALLPFILPNANAQTIMIVYALASLVALLLALYLSRSVNHQFKASKTAFEKKRWRKAAFPWLAISFVWDYLIDVMILLLGLFAASPEIAILHICFRFRVLAGFPMRSIYMLLMPDISASKATGKTDDFTMWVNRANVSSFGYALFTLIFFAFAGPFMLSLFGADMSKGLGALLAVISTLLVRAIFGPAPSILAIHDFHMASALLALSGLATAIILLLVLYPLYGVLGAAMAYTLANLLVSAVLWRYAIKKTGIDCSIFQTLRTLKTHH